MKTATIYIHPSVSTGTTYKGIVNYILEIQ